MKKHYIYKTTNIINKKYYIGKHSSEDIQNDDYLGSGTYLNRSIKKHGKKNFIREILFVFQSEQDAYKKQAQIITQDLIKDNNCYNQQIGGKGGLSGMVTIVDKNNKYYKVTKHQFENNNYRSIHQGMVGVIDNEGNQYKIKLQQFYKHPDKYIAISKGRLTVIDKKNNKFISIKSTQFSNKKHIHPNFNKVILNINGTNKLVSKDSVIYKSHKYNNPNINKCMFIDQNGDKCFMNIQQGLKLNYKKLSSITHKDKVVVKDKDGNTFQTSIDDPRYLSGQLVHITTGMVVVKDNEGNIFQTSIDDPRYLSGQLIGHTAGKTPVKDKKGNIFLISIDDPRYLSGQFVSVMKNKINVKDKDGNTFQTSIDDPRYLSGQLVTCNKDKIMITNGKETMMIDKNQKIPINWKKGSYKAKNKIQVIDKDKKIFKVDKDDPRYLSGQLISMNKGRRWITNNIINKTLREGDKMPDGFNYGRTKG